MNINIDRRDVKIIVSECLRYLLKEDQTAKSISAAIKLLMKETGMSHEEADNFIRDTLRSQIPTLRNDDASKFILGVTRMYINGDLNGYIDISNINAILKLVSTPENINKFDRNLNGLSLKELMVQFNDKLSDDLQVSNDELNKFETEKSKYNIVRIDSFEDASRYSDFTSWCITHDDSMFDSYTNYGTSQFYFCLIDGFDKVKQVEGENCPLDEYGLSMLAVCVNENGYLATCTCRWNHDNGGNDEILDVPEISKLIGKNFYSVFRPNSVWRTKLSEALDKMKNGKSPQQIFDRVGYNADGLRRVSLGGFYNYIRDDNSLLTDTWYNDAWSFEDGYGIVVNTWNKENLIDTNGNIVFKKWYDSIFVFRDGLAMCRFGSKYNFLSKNGSTISNVWFNDAYEFQGGVARVKIIGKGWNIINVHGKLMSDTYYEWIEYMSQGLMVVSLTNEDNVQAYNYIDANGNLKFKIWFIQAHSFDSSGLAIVTLPLGDDYTETVNIDIEGNCYNMWGEKLTDIGPIQ